MKNKITHFCYVPFTGLGLYEGFRGQRWLDNRIKVFKHFVVPSLQAQTSQDFKIWISWRREERHNKSVSDLYKYLSNIFQDRVVFTYSGVCFWDDKYQDEEAQRRLTLSVHEAGKELMNHVGDVDHVLMTIQPSDDCYMSTAVEAIQVFFSIYDDQAVTFKRGYIMDYTTKGLSEYNPKTNPPFFTIKFPKKTFLDAREHVLYTGPYKSHEYIGQKLRLGAFEDRGFLVGTHGENISTYYDHPYRGEVIEGREAVAITSQFGLLGVPPIVIKKGLRRWILKKLPHPIRRKLRYWLGERLWAPIYSWIRR